MPLDYPNLQHLALDLGNEYEKREKGQSHLEVFPAIRMLKGLKTLYIQTSNTTHIDGPADLTCCKQLQCVAVQDVQFCGLMALPAGCPLHASTDVEHHHRTDFDNIAHLVSGLTLHRRSQWKLHEISGWPFLQYYSHAANMRSLRKLRLCLNEGNFDWSSAERTALLNLDKTPSLELLEIDVHCDLTVSIDPRLPLKLLVVIAAGTLQVRTSTAIELSPTSMPTLKQMYLRWSSSIWSRYGPAAEGSHATHPESWAGVSFQQYMKEGQDYWTAQMPAGFQPGNLQECICGACPACLARANVPVLCGQAWTSKGFEQHLSPHCNREP